MNQDAGIVIKFQGKNMIDKNDNYFMGLALQEAQKAYKEDEVPVGAVIVIDGKVIASAHNMRQKSHDVFGHAECKVIQKATKKLGTWILDQATLYVTLEPCLMCSGAIIQSRIARLVYATKEPKCGCVGSICNVFVNNQLNHHTEVQSGILQEDCANLLKDYFSKKRIKNRSLND